jgi:hypothetical protein
VGLWGSFCGCALGSFLYSSFFSFSFFNKTHYYLSKKKKKIMFSVVGLKQKIWLRLLTWFAKLLITHRVLRLTVKFLKRYGSRSL